jgi:hypothetical protein
MSTRPESTVSSGSGITREPAFREASIRLLVQLCLPAKSTMTLSGVGDIVFRPKLLSGAACAAFGDSDLPLCEEIAIDYAGQSGMLCIESRIAVGLVNALLGLSPPTFVGQLTRMERGALEGTLATVLAKLGLVPSLRLKEREPGMPLPSGLVIAVSVEAGGARGRAWLCASEEFFKRAWTAWHLSCQAVAVWLELAHTMVTVPEVANAEPGDTVVFDETSPWLASKPWPVQIQRGASVVPAHWLADGSLVANEGGGSVLSRDTVTRPDRRTRSSSGALAGTHGAVERVEVRAEVACQLDHGAATMPLAVSRSEPVVLRVGDRPWAYGECAELDGAFAVKITRKPSD